MLVLRLGGRPKLKQGDTMSIHEQDSRAHEPTTFEQPEVEGQSMRLSSDENLKRSIAGLEGALASLRGLESSDAEVEGQSFRSFSDENLKHSIAKVEGALASLRELKSSDAEVEGQRLMSDENLKRSI